jgi:hypothetical protein
MLSDWIETLITPCPRWAREMGYVRELIGIRRRHRQWKSAWEPHCERSRRVIRQAIRRCRQYRKAIILGSGWLLDLPLSELAASFREVILVDLLHPLSTRWRTRLYRNVFLLATDVSGAAESVWRAVEQRSSLPRAAPTLFIDDTEVDLVVSLNLLSQLPCLPEQYLRQASIHPAEEITAFCTEVVQAHLDYLHRLPGVVTLIADFEAITISTAGAEVARHGTLYGIEFPFGGERWTWSLVPRKRSFPYHSEHLVVAGVVDIAKG